jgi:uncharacterized protein
MAHPEFQVSTDKVDEFYFNLTAKNGLGILSSQEYKGKERYLSCFASVKMNSSSKKHYRRKDSGNDQFCFILKAANSKVIGKSQMYTSDTSPEDDIESIKVNAKRSKINYL